MSTSASQIWHDLISKLEASIAPIKHLFDEHQASFDEAVSQLRQQADAEVGHLVGDAEAAGESVLHQAETAAAPLVDEGKSVFGDLAHTAEAGAEQVLSGDTAATAAPTEAAPATDTAQSAEAAPETTAPTVAEPTA